MKYVIESAIGCRLIGTREHTDLPKFTIFHDNPNIIRGNLEDMIKLSNVLRERYKNGPYAVVPE